MATASPPRKIKSASAGEQRVFAILQKLPDTCFVYHEPVVRGRRPDFVVIIPDIGVLIIEVKGGRAGQILEADPKTILWKRVSRERREQHPAEQAYGYRRSLMDDCQDSFHSEILCNHSGRYKGNLSFPVGHCAVLSQIDRAQLHDRLGADAARIFDPQTSVTRDVLDRWEVLDGDGLKNELKDCFTTYWDRFPGLSEAQIDALRGLVHPSGKVCMDPDHQTDIRTLDELQRQCAFHIGAGHRILSGVAGSGKTIILIARAKFLSETQAGILLLCYNRNLCDYFKSELSDYTHKLSAATFHQWAAQELCGWQDREHETDSEYGERALAHLEAGSPEAGKYDAVLIDEGQDFPRTWFECAKLAVKDPDPERGHLLIAGDAAQAFRMRDFSRWSDAGIRASGRGYRKRFNLDRNYRNTRPILDVARLFETRSKSAARSVEDEGSGLAPPAIDPAFALRDGPLPELVHCASRQDECDYVASRVDAWLLGSHRHTVRPQDIAILYPYRPNADGYANLRRLFDRLKRHGLPNWLASEAKQEGGQRTGLIYTGRLAASGVKVSPIQGFKGLQARIVIVMWADLLPSGWRKLGTEYERAELYVGLTRAEDRLVVSCSRDSPFLKEMRAKLGVLAVRA